MFLKLRNNHRKISVSESLFNKVTGLKACIFIKKDTPTQVFSYEYCKIFKNSFFMEHLFITLFQNLMWWRILDIWWLYFAIVKLGHVAEGTSDRSKFLVKICFFLNQDFNSPSKIFLLFNHFAFTKICKALKLQRETSGSNSTILISNFSKYI